MTKTRYTGVHYRINKTKKFMGKEVKTFYISYKHNGKLIRQKVGDSSDGIDGAYCNQIRQETLTKLRLGENAPIQQKKTIKTFGAVAEEYFEQLEARSKPKLESVYNNHLKHLEDDNILKIDIDKLRRDKNKEISKKTKKPLSPKTVNNILIQASAILHFAKDKKYIKELDPIKKNQVSNERQRYLNEDEVQELYQAIIESNLPTAKRLLLFTKIALTTGARVGSILQIKIMDINLKERSVNIYDEKNETYYRGFLTDEIISMIPKGLKPTDKLIDVSDIRQIQRPLKKIFDKLFNDGVDDIKYKVVLHTLRHSFASNLAINGTPIFTIQKLMNHKNIDMTLRYAKLAPDTGAEAVRGLYQ